jgi:hypothetical protein
LVNGDVPESFSPLLSEATAAAAAATAACALAMLVGANADDVESIPAGISMRPPT